jgi:hypothetical protein
MQLVGQQTLVSADLDLAVNLMATYHVLWWDFIRAENDAQPWLQVRSMMAPPLELPAAVAAVCRAVTGDTLHMCDDCMLPHGWCGKHHTAVVQIAIKHNIRSNLGDYVNRGYVATGKDAGDGKDGSDSDDFVATSMIISLRCPLSGSRIVTPARYTLQGTMLAGLHMCQQSDWAVHSDVSGRLQ